MGSLPSSPGHSPTKGPCKERALHSQMQRSSSTKAWAQEVMQIHHGSALQVQLMVPKKGKVAGQL